jgi:ABC-type uncharacterized transport system substrate-binding protein
LISGAWRRAAIARRNATGFSDILAVSNREFVEAGGLMSYGPNFPDLFRRAGDYVDKILRGAKPADIPVEQPTKFDARRSGSKFRQRCSLAPTR